MTHADSVATRFAAITGVELDAPLAEWVAAVQRVPYRRAAGRTPDSVLESGCGTCSTKHYLLQALMRELWPEVRVAVVHRVYRLMPADAERLFGAGPASTVPAGGLVDVHTFLEVLQEGGVVALDITYPTSPPWDGRSSMTVQCGAGEDHPAGDNPDDLKQRLVSRFCDPSLREPFIAALSAR